MNSNTFLNVGKYTDVVYIITIMSNTKVKNRMPGCKWVNQLKCFSVPSFWGWTNIITFSHLKYAC